MGQLNKIITYCLFIYLLLEQIFNIYLINCVFLMNNKMNMEYLMGNGHKKLVINISHNHSSTSCTFLENNRI